MGIYSFPAIFSQTLTRAGIIMKTYRILSPLMRGNGAANLPARKFLSFRSLSPDALEKKQLCDGVKRFRKSAKAYLKAERRVDNYLKYSLKRHHAKNHDPKNSERVFNGLLEKRDVLYTLCEQASAPLAKYDSGLVLGLLKAKDRFVKDIIVVVVALFVVRVAEVFAFVKTGANATYVASGFGITYVAWRAFLQHMINRQDATREEAKLDRLGSLYREFLLYGSVGKAASRAADSD